MRLVLYVADCDREYGDRLAKAIGPGVLKLVLAENAALVDVHRTLPRFGVWSAGADAQGLHAAFRSVLATGARMGVALTLDGMSPPAGRLLVGTGVPETDAESVAEEIASAPSLSAAVGRAAKATPQRTAVRRAASPAVHGQAQHWRTGFALGLLVSGLVGLGLMALF